VEKLVDAPNFVGGVLGVLGVSVVEYMEWESPSPFTSPSANWRNAEPTPLREIKYKAWDAARLWREVTVCFIKRFRCLHIAKPSSWSTLEFEQPIVNFLCAQMIYLSERNSTFIKCNARKCCINLGDRNPHALWMSCLTIALHSWRKEAT